MATLYALTMQTPLGVSTHYAADFVLSIPGCSRIDIPCS
jgi:hypothetical protein